MPNKLDVSAEHHQRGYLSLKHTHSSDGEGSEGAVAVASTVAHGSASVYQRKEDLHAHLAIANTHAPHIEASPHPHSHTSQPLEVHTAPQPEPAAAAEVVAVAVAEQEPKQHSQMQAQAQRQGDNCSPRYSRRGHVRRNSPYKAAYDAPIVRQLLDESLVCTISYYDAETKQTNAVPTTYAREGDFIYIQGKSRAASSLLQAVIGEAPVCVTTCLLDGIVVARSAIHHSLNYRSVTFMACGEEIHDPVEKVKVMKLITEHIVPGRWEGTRPPTEEEVKAVTIARLSILEATVRLRRGMASDDRADIELEHWAGVLPIRTEFGPAIPNRDLPKTTPVPEAIKYYSRAHTQQHIQKQDWSINKEEWMSFSHYAWLAGGIAIGSVAALTLSRCCS